MRKSEDHLDNRIKAYIETLFAGVGESQQLFYLKEEIAANLREKTLTNRIRGISEEQAFKEAIVSLGDLSAIVADMRKLGQEEAQQVVCSTVWASLWVGIYHLGIIIGLLLIFFGFFNLAMLYFMQLETINVSWSCVFITMGGALVVFLILNGPDRRKVH